MQIVRSRMSASLKCSRKPREELVVELEVSERKVLGVLDRDLLGVRVLGMVAMLGDVRVHVLGDALFRQLRNPPTQSNGALVDLRDPHAHRFAHTSGELALVVDGRGQLRHRPTHLGAE